MQVCFRARGGGGILLQPGCSAHTHLLRSVDDAGVVAELQGTQHRSSHGEHQASRHLQEKGEEKKRGVKLGVPAMPPLSGGGGGFSPGAPRGGGTLVRL